MSFAMLAERQAAQMILELAPAPKAERTGALRSYHVRSHQTALEAAVGEAKAQTQNETILAWMRAHRGRHTPSAVHTALSADHPWPLTSIRRGLTDMARAGLLRHWPADRRPGAYGALNSTWEAL
jgi:hypothetical protein